MSFKKSHLCFGNWKLNKNLEEATTFFKDLKSELTQADLDHFCIFPSSVLCERASQSELNWGGQNCYFENSGAFTGETSPEVLSSMGAKFCLVGHSERRQIFKETDEALNKKTQSVLSNEMTPVFCIGETEEERESGKTFEVLESQIKKGLLGIDLSKVIVAYEPVWAIGTGKTATPEIAGEVHNWLRERLSCPLLYGGSVKPANSAELYRQSNIDGFLIGGASLKADSFSQIYKEMRAV